MVLISVMMWIDVLVLTCIIRHGIADAGPWWRNAVYYRILVDSFKDSDGDGLGDLKGATKQISYVRAIGADAVILSPLYVKNKDCDKPGAIDFCAIDERYGSLDSFNELLEKAKKLELKVLVNLPLQTISVDSDWFTSSTNLEPGFEDRILWRDGQADAPLKDEGNRSWIWNAQRKAYWKSLNKEAILNLCSEIVIAAFSSVQCSWIRRGVSGVLLEPDFPEEVQCGEKLLKRLTSDARNCARGAGLDVPVILVESSLESQLAAQYYEEHGMGANIVLNRALTSHSRPSAATLGIAVYTALLTTPQDASTAWITSAVNGSRITTRYGSDTVDMINLIALTLPGATVIHQGDELGVADTILEWIASNSCWPNQGFPSSAPFPWDDTVNAGFSAADPWVPLAPNFRYTNAKTEFNNDFSHLSVVKLASAMRKSPAFGPHVEVQRLDGAIGIFRWGGTGSLLLIANLAQEQAEVLPSKIPGLPAEMTVAVSSSGSTFSSGSHVAMDKSIKLGLSETVLLAGGPRHCGGPGPVDKIATKLSEGWQKFNKYFSNM